VLRTLVVDDEKLARDRLCGFLRAMDGVEVIGEAANGPEAVAMIEDRRPDLVLLDVQMPGMDGFGVLRQLTHKPAVVFATAYDNYAIKAFEVQAADYLLKPISRDRLRETVRRISDRRARAVADADLQQAMRALRPATSAMPRSSPCRRGGRSCFWPPAMSTGSRSSTGSSTPTPPPSGS
jgi:two-component system LytT family response regulator